MPRLLASNLSLAPPSHRAADVRLQVADRLAALLDEVADHVPHGDRPENLAARSTFLKQSRSEKIPTGAPAPATQRGDRGECTRDPLSGSRESVAVSRGDGR